VTLDTTERIFDQERWARNCGRPGHADTCECSKKPGDTNPTTGKPITYVDAKHKIPHDERYARLAEKFVAVRSPPPGSKEAKSKRNRRKRGKR